tara:strand:- start:247 stop:1011 length:765 start_codon:yes stop_codon:yes gene_type:complete
MIIAQISDTHLICVSSKFKVIAENRIKYLENCVSNILGLRPQPDAIIHTGDVSHNGLIEEYRLAYKILNRLNSPIFFTPGNRDDKNNLKSIFLHSYLTNAERDQFIYSTYFKDFRIISMDTSCKKNNQGEITLKGLEIFSQILMENKEIPTVIFMHHPPYDVSLSSNKNIEYNSEKLIPKFWKILESFNVIGLFCGHIHRNFQTKVGNIISQTLPPIALDLSRDKKVNKELNKIQYFLHTYSKSTGIVSEKILV